MGSKKKRRCLETKDNLKTFYGIPHCHTSYSTGKGTIKDAIKHSKKNSLDYIIFTDHYRYLNKKLKDKSIKWEIEQQEIMKYKRHHKEILPIMGFEYKLTPQLHINIINSDKCIESKLSKSDFFKWLKSNECIGIINHPGESIKIIKKDIYLNKYINCIEVANGNFPIRYKRYYKNYFALLDAGWKLGAVNGQDNHKDDWGDSDNLTAVLSKKLSAEDLFYAYKNMKTYSTESRTLKIRYSINNVYMGGTLAIEKSDILHFSVSAEDKNYAIRKVKIITNGGKVINESNDIQRNEFDYSFTLKEFQDCSWFVVNLLLENSREALTSPIYIKCAN